MTETIAGYSLGDITSPLAKTGIWKLGQRKRRLDGRRHDRQMSPSEALRLDRQLATPPRTYLDDRPFIDGGRAA